MQENLHTFKLHIPLVSVNFFYDDSKKPFFVFTYTGGSFVKHPVASFTRAQKEEDGS